MHNFEEEYYFSITATKKARLPVTNILGIRVCWLLNKEQCNNSLNDSPIFIIIVF